MSSAMEFAITTDLTPLKEFNISANFAECQAWLEENLAPYRGMVVTEEVPGQHPLRGGTYRRVPEDGQGRGAGQLRPL